MALPDNLLKLVQNRDAANRGASQHHRVKHGLEIFGDGDYPTDWSDFVGQTQAVEQIRTAVASAHKRDKRLDHMLLACGLAGIGKTTLAKLAAYYMGVGYAEIGQNPTIEDARRVLMGMEDGDILFWDEIHTAGRADWLLTFLTDHVLLGKNGAQEMADVTVIGATTDVGRLPATYVSRFMIQPLLERYTVLEGTQIARKLAKRMGVPVPNSAAPAIARAANNSPRAMRQILTAVRDLDATRAGDADLAQAFRWVGVTRDGLSRLSQEVLIILLTSPGYTAARATIQGTLGEPGPLRFVEDDLYQRGYITIGGRGRTLTEEGVTRTLRLIDEGDAA